MKEAVRDGELVAREAERFACGHFVDAGDFVHDAAGLHFGGPLFDAAFAATHADFERLLRDRAMRINANPELAGTFDVTLNRHARRFDLARRESAGLEALHREVAECNGASARSDAAVIALLHFAVLGSFRGKHRVSLGVLSGGGDRGATRAA